LFQQVQIDGIQFCRSSAGENHELEEQAQQLGPSAPFSMSVAGGAT
jgi:hypothetical protein